MNQKEYNAIIERCAQTVETEGNLWSNDTKAMSEVAAAVRRLKYKATEPQSVEDDLAIDQWHDNGGQIIDKSKV